MKATSGCRVALRGGGSKSRNLRRFKGELYLCVCNSLCTVQITNLSCFPIGISSHISSAIRSRHKRNANALAHYH